MSLIKVFKNNLKQIGFKRAMLKVINFLKREIRYCFKKTPIVYYYFKLKFLKSFLGREKERSCKILGYKIFFEDLKSLFIEYKDIFKNEIYRFKSDKDKPIIIDGGGFIGLSVLYFKRLYPMSKIKVFEPSEKILKFLEKNIEGNKIENIEIIKKALSKDEGHLYFKTSATDAGKIDSQGDKKIESTRLSGYVDGEVDFMKLNIEGVETDVMHDLDSNDKLKYINQLCIEWHSFAYRAQDLDEILLILKKNNYKYIINHFDYITNGAVKPPFTVEDKTQFYLLIYAKKNNTTDKK